MLDKILDDGEELLELDEEKDGELAELLLNDKADEDVLELGALDDDALLDDELIGDEDEDEKDDDDDDEDGNEGDESPASITTRPDPPLSLVPSSAT
jgi:hypothetical protein